jgi:hypothetical protein
MSMRPISIVEDEGVREILSFLGYPNKGAPTRVTINSKIDHCFEAIQESIKNESAPSTGVGSIALTTDGWTSPAKDAFIAATGHYLNADWQLQSLCLGTSVELYHQMLIQMGIAI